MQSIPLHNRHGDVVAHTLIDDCDAHLAEFRWCLNDQGYARRAIYPGGKHKALRLHREVMQAPAGMEVDHVNGDRLDNRRSNLRIVTRAQQMQNQASNANTTSQYRGVNWHKQRQKWRAEATVDGRCHYLGLFEYEQDAADAAREFRIANMSHTNEAR